MKPIVIIGAGLSGLACALTLSRAGKKVLILEQKKNVGGRVFTENHPSGFLVDEGFQVLLTSYPELNRFVELKTLKLHSFHSGALIFNGHGLQLLANPFRHPFQCFETLKFSSASLRDKALVVKLMAEVLIEKPEDQLGTQTTLAFLTDLGFSPSFIEDFWKPFLTGVYLDPTLSVGSGFFRFLMRCFAWGKVTLPEQGMNQLPQAMAKQLPKDSIRLSQTVETWEPHKVVLKNGETLEASSVVCAFDPQALNPEREKHFRKATTYYFTSSSLSSLGWEKWLVLVPPRFGLSLSHLALVSSVSPAYGKKGEPLLSATAVGDSSFTEAQIMQEIEKVAGKALRLIPIAKTVVPHALPILKGDTPGFEKRDGIWFCGDRFASPSINGALRSGRLAAEALL